MDGSELGPLMVDQNNIIDGTRLIADISLLRMLKRSADRRSLARSDMSTEQFERLKTFYRMDWRSPAALKQNLSHSLSMHST